jgi:type IV secretory pathway VirB2 component (pilin)
MVMKYVRPSGLFKLHAWGAKPAGVLAGLVAGAAYILAQMLFSSLLGSNGVFAPLQRIAAMLLGPDAAPPGHALGIEVTMGLLIHAPLSLVAGLVISHWVRGKSINSAALLGSAAGLFFFVIAFFVVAPSAFPWFLDVRNPATAFDHLIFGAIAGSMAASLQRPTSISQTEKRHLHWLSK